MRWWSSSQRLWFAGIVRVFACFGWKSRAGRPSIPEELRRLIRQMARENPLWGEERIANELLLKLGLRVSPRTVRKHMAKRPSGGPRGDQRWSTFLRNHAEAVLACDFFVAVTVTFQVLYVFIILNHGSRRILHCNATAHPTSGWTRQQLREAIPSDHQYRFLIHDRGRVFSKELDCTAENMGLRVLKAPYRSSQANSICERTIGSMRRECLDHMIPLTENHLRRVLKGLDCLLQQSETPFCTRAGGAWADKGHPCTPTTRATIELETVGQWSPGRS